MPDKNIKILRKGTYLKAIENSVGTKLFNSLIVEFQDSKEVKDILNDGEYSCAFFVSSILYLLGAIDKTHSTVKNLNKTLKNNNKWKEVNLNDLEGGDVIFWEKIKFEDGSEDTHVGFAVNKEEAVSTSYKKKAVDRHLINPNERRIEGIFRYAWDD